MTDRQHRRAAFFAALLVAAAGHSLSAVEPADEIVEPAALEGDMTGEPVIAPNPADCRLGDTAITFSRIPTSARVRLYTLEGRLLREIEVSESGDAVWDLCNTRGEPVATGIYLALVTADGERRAAKVAVQR